MTSGTAFFELITEFVEECNEYCKRETVVNRIKQVLCEFPELVNSRVRGIEPALHKLVRVSSHYQRPLVSGRRDEALAHLTLIHDIIDFVIALEVNVNERSIIGKTPLMDAYDPLVIQKLVEAGADVYAQNDEMTVLHYYAIYAAENAILAIAELDTIDHHRLVHSGRDLALNRYRKRCISTGLNPQVVEYLEHGTQPRKIGMVTKRVQI